VLKILQEVKCSWWVEDMLLRPWFLRFVLVIASLFILGVPQCSFNEIKKEQASRLPIQQEMQARKSYAEYAESLVSNAESRIKKGGDYNIKDYFADLKLLDLKMKELKANYIGDFGIISKLQDLSRLSKTKFNDTEIEVISKDYKQCLMDLRGNREEIERELKAFGISGFLLGLWSIYVILLLPALFWMIVDCYKLYEDSGWEKEERFLFPSPGRFLLMWLLYPFTFGVILWKWLKNNKQRYLAEAELRRTKKNLFGSLTEEELKRLKEFGEKNLSLSIWRQQLKTLGLRPRHCLVTALVATLIISLLPGISRAEKKNDNVGVALEQIVKNHAARSDIADDSQIQLYNGGLQDDVAVVGKNSFEPQEISVFIKECENILRLQEVSRRIFHVPLFGYSF
jgi:hypothetical protein